MILKEDINMWLEAFEGSENANSKEAKNWDNNLKIRLVEAKFLIDRWQNVANNLVVHSSKKDLLKEKLADLISTRKKPNKEKFINEVESILAKYNQDTSSLSSLKNLIDKVDDFWTNEFADNIWGMTIHYSDNCPEDKAIMLYLDEKRNLPNANSVVVFPM
jgi:hypothetical protein